ncbi:hypothetical protein D3C81_1911070 [compost metagenome]
MTQLRYHSTCHKLMMQCLINGLQPVLNLVGQNAATRVWAHSQDINFVKGQPVFHLVPVAGEYSLGVFYIMANHFTAGPSVILQGQTKRCLIMGQCYQRLNTVF